MGTRAMYLEYKAHVLWPDADNEPVVLPMQYCLHDDYLSGEALHAFGARMWIAPAMVGAIWSVVTGRLMRCALVPAP